MTEKQYFQNSHCRSNKDDLSAIALKLGLEGLNCPKQFRVEHKIFAPLGPRDCPRAISRALGCKLSQGAYFPIHPSSWQCIITLFFSWRQYHVVNTLMSYASLILSRHPSVIHYQDLHHHIPGAFFCDHLLPQFCLPPCWCCPPPSSSCALPFYCSRASTGVLEH